MYDFSSVQSVQSLSRVRIFATAWIAARQASLSITNSRSSLRLTFIESVMPSIIYWSGNQGSEKLSDFPKTIQLRNWKKRDRNPSQLPRCPFNAPCYPDGGEEWRQKEKGTTEDEMLRQHHRLNWTNSRRSRRTEEPGVLQFIGITKSQTRLSDWGTRRSPANQTSTSTIGQPPLEAASSATGKGKG